MRVVPYLLIGAVMAGIEIWTQHLAGAEAAVGNESFFSRLAIAGRAVWFYLGKLLWPVDLCMIYPRWQIDPRNVLAYLPGALLLVLLALAWWKTAPHLGPADRDAAHLLCGLAAPRSGVCEHLFHALFIRSGSLSIRSHDCALVLFAGLATMFFQRLGRRWIGYVLGGALLAALAFLTWQQSAIYADQETLYRATIKENPDCWLAYDNLGFALVLRGKGEEAMPLFQKAARIAAGLSGSPLPSWN